MLASFVLISALSCVISSSGGGGGAPSPAAGLCAASRHASLTLATCERQEAVEGAEG